MLCFALLFLGGHSCIMYDFNFQRFVFSWDKDIIRGPDQNIGFLKLNTNKYSFLLFEEMMSIELFPTVTKPTQITYNTATVIDNISISSHLLRDFPSAILMDDISDHLPHITIVNRGLRVYKKLIEIEFWNINNENIKMLHSTINATNWVTWLRNDINVDEMYSIFIVYLQDNINIIMPSNNENPTK